MFSKNEMMVGFSQADFNVSSEKTGFNGCGMCFGIKKI